MKVTERAEGMSRVDRFVLPRPMRDDVLIHLLECTPNEGVGMIGVHQPVQDNGKWIAQGALFVPGENTDRSPTHFTMDGRDVARAFLLFREAELELGAIVHSHIASPATPSSWDVQEWNYPDAIMLIASFAQQPPALRAWRIVDENGLAHVREVTLQITDDQNTEQSSGDS